MTRNAIYTTTLAMVICLGVLGGPGVARADSLFELMNPFNWFFDDDDDDYYRYHGWGGPYGRAGPYGWGGPWGQYGYQRPQMVIVLPEDNAVDSQVAVVPE
jgi:hypothetical protein